MQHQINDLNALLMKLALPIVISYITLVAAHDHVSVQTEYVSTEVLMWTEHWEMPEPGNNIEIQDVLINYN